MNSYIGTFSVQNLADYFSVDRNTIYRWRREGLLPEGFRIGQKRRWSSEELIHHLSPQCKLFKENSKTYPFCEEVNMGKGG